MSDLRALSDRYNDAWNRHDVEAIVAMHAPDMVFENHTAGERAQGEEVREHNRAEISSRRPAATGSSGRGWT